MTIYMQHDVVLIFLPLSLRTSAHDQVSQGMLFMPVSTLLSTEQEASHRSSGDQATSRTLFMWPRSVVTCFQFSTLGWSLLPKARAPDPALSSYMHTSLSSDPADVRQQRLLKP